MKVSRELIGVLVLVCLFIVLSLSFAGKSVDQSSRQAVDDLPGKASVDSSYSNSRSSGSLGAFSLTRRLGYRPIVWRHGWKDLAGSGSKTLLVINPGFDSNVGFLSGSSGQPTDQTTTLTAADWTTLQSWLKLGNNAILLTSDLSSSYGSQSGQQAAGSTAFGDAAGLEVNSAIPSGRRSFSPSLPGPYTSGIMRLYSDSDARVRQSVPNGVALFTDSAGALAICKPIGAGRLIVVADAQLFSNENLGHSDNSVFFANLLGQSSGSGGIVLFDEYHHGDAVADSGATMWTVLGRPLQLAIIQGSVALLALLAVLAMRFGKPISLTQGQIRHTGEYVTSLAALNRRAGATAVALETIYRQFLRDLCSRLGISPDTRLDVLARTAGKRTIVSESALRNLLVLCEQRLDEGRLPEPELLELVRQMEQIRKDVGIA